MGASQSATLVQDNGRAASEDTHQAILRQEMSRRSIHSAHISSRFTSRTMRGYGIARCRMCSRRWTSHQASAKIDLNNLTVKVWRQKCQNCDQLVEMTFKEDEYKRMVNNMLDRLERQMRGETLSNHDDATRGGHGPPHRKELCEGCDWGSGDCRVTSQTNRGFSGQSSVRSYSGDNSNYRGGSSGGGGGNGDGDSDTGRIVVGSIALGVGLLAVGGALAYAFSSYNEKEEQKKREGKK
ncbi:uncharacterized protein LOC100888777 [Strongylocentrotus purpuratus]|uniref:3CxxC-type domain-containing protein n=1 Tax=Strongylocentrotus purpuratus TaxID=7668 RepID=A0A7M7N0J7_STRPU|nr:uncharacterized protein LOC100888777 [Strongylocentrotus purpuratus]